MIRRWRRMRLERSDGLRLSRIALAGDRKSADDSGDEAGRQSAPPAQVELPGGLGGIDEAAVHARARPLGEGLDAGPEGRVGEHRAVDQHGVSIVAPPGVAGQGAGEEGVAAGPFQAAPGEHLVELGDGEGREGAGEAGGGARREDQFDRIGEGQIVVAFVLEGEGDAMLALADLGR